MYVCMYVREQVCVYVCMYIYVYMLNLNGIYNGNKKICTFFVIFTNRIQLLFIYCFI